AFQKTNHLRPIFLRPTASYRIGRKQIGRENIRDATNHIESRFLGRKRGGTRVQGRRDLAGAQGRERRSGAANVQKFIVARILETFGLECPSEDKCSP